MSGKILITGGTGLIGSHLCGALSRRGYEIVSFSRNARFLYPELVAENDSCKIRLVKGDIDNKKLLTELVQQADVIFHNAAVVGAPNEVRNAAQFVSTNVKGTANLVEILYECQHNVKKVILGSSISVYGEGNYSCIRCGIVRPNLRTGRLDVNLDWEPVCPLCDGPVRPTPTNEDAARKGQSVYSKTKIAQEDLLSACCESMGISLAIFRYSTVYGPGQSELNPYSGFLKLLALGRSPVVHEDGKQTRDFIFVDDAVESNLLYLENSLAGIHIFNVGSGKQTTVLEFAQNLSKIVSQSLSVKDITPIVSYSQGEESIRHCQIDCCRISEMLGFRARTDLESGIQQLANWFFSHCRDRGTVTNPL